MNEHKTWGLTETGSVFHSFKADGVAICRSNVKAGYMFRNHGGRTEAEVDAARQNNPHLFRKCESCAQREAAYRDRLAASMAPVGEYDQVCEGITGYGDAKPQAVTEPTPGEYAEAARLIEDIRPTGRPVAEVADEDDMVCVDGQGDEFFEHTEDEIECRRCGADLSGGDEVADVTEFRRCCEHASVDHGGRGCDECVCTTARSDMPAQGGTAPGNEYEVADRFVQGMTEAFPRLAAWKEEMRTQADEALAFAMAAGAPVAEPGRPVRMISGRTWVASAAEKGNTPHEWTHTGSMTGTVWTLWATQSTGESGRWYLTGPDLEGLFVGHRLTMAAVQADKTIRNRAALSGVRQRRAAVEEALRTMSTPAPAEAPAPIGSRNVDGLVWSPVMNRSEWQHRDARGNTWTIVNSFGRWYLGTVEGPFIGLTFQDATRVAGRLVSTLRDA